MKHPNPTCHQIDVQSSSYTSLLGLVPYLKTGKLGRMVVVSLDDDHQNNLQSGQPILHKNGFAAGRINQLRRFDVSDLLLKLLRLRFAQAPQLLLFGLKIETAHEEPRG